MIIHDNDQPQNSSEQASDGSCILDLNEVEPESDYQEQHKKRYARKTQKHNPLDFNNYSNIGNNPPSQEVIHALLREFGADLDGLTKAIIFESWTRWGKKNRYGAKLIYGDSGDDGLVFIDFVSSDKVRIGFFKDEQVLSLEEREERKQSLQKAQLSFEIERKKRQEETALEATKIWQECSETGISEYLSRKKIKDYGVRYGKDQYGSFVAIPLYDVDGKFWNLQKIYDPKPDGSNNKWFLTGGRKNGCFHVLGKPLSEQSEQALCVTDIFVCEGYATGASIHYVTGCSVIVAFDAGNIEPVVDCLKKAYPGVNIIISADNDRFSEDGKNKGLKEAHKASEKHRCTVIYPKFKPEHASEKPTDFNDLYILEGFEETRKQLFPEEHGSENNVSDEELKKLSKPSLPEKEKTLGVWENPQDIKTELLPVEPLPLDIIPIPFQAWLQDISERMQCPLEQVAIPAMLMIGSLIGAGCAIRPKCNDSWTIIPNLWGGIIGLPSSLKSPALAETLSPISYLENGAREKFKEEQEEYKYEFEAHKILKESKISQIKSNLKTNKLSSEDITKEMKEVEAPTIPLWRRFKTNDATIEKMVELLERNPRGLMLFRDELIGLLLTWDKQGRESDRAFYLEAWNGYGSHTTDRIERGTIHCDNMCVSILGGTTPSKILAYLQKAIRGIENDGLVQRLQLFVYPDEIEEWKLIDNLPNKDAEEIVFKIAETIALMDFTDYGALKDEDSKIPYFRFSEEAQELFYEWLTGLETQKLRGDEDSIIIQHLSKYRKLMPALALIIHIIDIACGKSTGPISFEAAARAAAWCDFLEPHAKRIYGMHSNIAVLAATVLLKNIKKRKLEDGFTVRDVYRKQWSLLTETEIAQDACDELVKLGWLKEVTVEASFGQKGKVTYFINPKIWGQS